MVVPAKALRDYTICAGICGLSYALAPLDGAFPISIGRLIAWSSILGVGMTTFRWGAAIGYPIRDDAGHFCLGHVLRSLAMTGVMTIVVVGASMPLFLIVGAVQTSQQP